MAMHLFSPISCCVVAVSNEERFLHECGMISSLICGAHSRKDLVISGKFIARKSKIE